jgi:hypothetical protein
MQSQLDAERAAVAELRQALARAEESSAALGHDTSRGQQADEDVAYLQKSLGEARHALAAVQAELDDVRVTTAEIRQNAEQVDQQLASARSSEAQAVADHQRLAAELERERAERNSIAGELQAARKWINELSDAEAEFALPPSPSQVAAAKGPAAKGPAAKAPAAKAPAAKASATPPPPVPVEPEEGWQAVRLANRYVFNTELTVQVNGNPARLYDVSISGCQLLSATALKPNQMVKIVLPDTPPQTCAGKVVWTRLEPMAMGQPLGYRAGVRFTKVDEAAIETFASRRATPA